jgi:hypothetical protein
METVDVLEVPYQPAKDWGDGEWNNFTSWLNGMLKVTDMTVTFTKKDGTERVMKCTLKSDALPVVEAKPLQEGKQPRKESTSSIRVFDLEKQEWRSCRYDSIKRIQFSLGQ